MIRAVTGRSGCRVLAGGSQITDSGGAGGERAASLGVRRGPRIATLLPNSDEILDVWCAAARPTRCSRGDDPGARPEQHAVAGRVPGERYAQPAQRGVHGAFLAAGVLVVPLAVVFGYLTDRLLRARLQAAP